MKTERVAALNRAIKPVMESLETRVLFGYGWSRGGETPDPSCDDGAGGGTGVGGGGGMMSPQQKEQMQASGGGSGPGGAACCDEEQSEGPIRYLNGTPVFDSEDLVSEAFGYRWGHVRSWTGLNEGSQNGNGWMVTSLPYMVVKQNQYSHDGIVSVVFNNKSGRCLTHRNLRMKAA